jgi:hypothetical protein
LNSLPDNLGQYVFGALGTTGGFANFVTGAASGASVTFQRLTSGRPSLYLHNYDEALFAQDTIQVSHSLSVDMGLRYELFGQPIDQLHSLFPSDVPYVNQYKKNFGPRIGFAWSPKANVVVRGGYGIQYNPTIFDIPLSMWQSGPISPLVVTVSPAAAALVNEPATVLQPGAGNVFPSAPFSTAAQVNTALNTGVKSCGPDTTTNSSEATIAAPGVTIAGNVPVGNCSNEFTAASTLRNPYVQNYSLGIQWEFHPSWLFEVSFVGSKGSQLFLRQDMNPLDGWGTSGVCTTLNVANIGCLKPRQDPTHGDITEVTNSGFSTYSSLQTSLTKHYDRTRAGDFTFTGAYTWSHMIDNASEIFGPAFQFLAGPVGNSQQSGDFLTAFYTTQSQGLQSGDADAITPFAQSPTNLAAEKANSSFDRRHRLSSSYLWEPFPTKNVFVRGWQLNGIATYQSGQPFSPLNGSPTLGCSDPFGEGILTNDRPAIGNPNAPLGSVAVLTNCAVSASGLTAANYSMDPASAHFVQEPLGVTPGQVFNVGTESFKAGSAGRNSLIGPNLVEWDAALMKNFHFGESKVLQFRWEVYDALNHKNPGFTIGNVFASNAQPTVAYAFSGTATPSSVTGVIPENAIDAKALVASTTPGQPGTYQPSFLTKQFMNTSARTMQFGVKFTF